MVRSDRLQPEYNICKQCLLEGKLLRVFISEHREQHMEKYHLLTEDDLKEMIQRPRLYFLSLQQTVDILSEAIPKKRLAGEILVKGKK